MPLKVFNSKGELKGHYGTDQHWILLLTGFIVARSTLATTHFKGIESLYRWTSPLLPCLLSIFLVIFQKKVCSLRLVRDWIPAMSKKKKKNPTWVKEKHPASLPLLFHCSYSGKMCRLLNDCPTCVQKGNNLQNTPKAERLL